MVLLYYNLAGKLSSLITKNTQKEVKNMKILQKITLVWIMFSLFFTLTNPGYFAVSFCLAIPGLIGLTLAMSENKPHFIAQNEVFVVLGAVGWLGILFTVSYIFLAYQSIEYLMDSFAYKNIAGIVGLFFFVFVLPKIIIKKIFSWLTASKTSKGTLAWK